MKFKDLAAMSETDRKKKVAESKIELIKLNGQVATGTTPKSPGQIRQIKKLIAQVLTLERQQQMQESKVSPKVNTEKK